MQKAFTPLEKLQHKKRYILSKSHHQVENKTHEITKNFVDWCVENEIKHVFCGNPEGESAVSKNSTKSYKFIVFFELLFLKYAKINLYSVRRPLVPRDSIAPTWSDFSIRRGRSKLLHPLVCKRNGVRCSLFLGVPYHLKS